MPHPVAASPLIRTPQFALLHHLPHFALSPDTPCPSLATVPHPIAGSATPHPRERTTLVRRTTMAGRVAVLE
jgi:hypothetical protein